MSAAVLEEYARFEDFSYIHAKSGIFALGTSSHAYLEFDLVDPNKIEDLVSDIAAIREPRTTIGGVNFVIGFRPELWQSIAPDEAPENLESFRPIEGAEGFSMPATQHDALVWLSGNAYPLARYKYLLQCLATTCPDASIWESDRQSSLIEASGEAFREVAAIVNIALSLHSKPRSRPTPEISTVFLKALEQKILGAEGS